MTPDDTEPTGPRLRVMWMSTFAFTVLFAVWLMLGVLGLEIKKDTALMLGADDAASMTPDQIKAAVESRFEWLLAAAILAGSLPRLNFGIWADKHGGRNMMVGLLLFCAIPAYGLAFASSYAELLTAATLFGLAGNSFTVGIAWNSAWFPTRQKGTALGVFGAGNVGASGTKLLVVLVPTVLTLIPVGGYLGGLIPGGWRFVPVLYAALLVLTAVGVWFVCPKVDHCPGRGRPLGEMLAPLKHVRVWRLSLYYVVVFGAYVALSSWLPNYYRNTFGVDLRTAALLTAMYIFPASLLRPLGGYLSDKFGPRVVTYAVFVGMTVALIPLCLPTHVLDLGVTLFTGLMVVVGVGMGIGKASVYKYVPNYFPKDVGAVGGLVGMLGALGGFVLPPVFGMVGRATGSPQAAFVALLALTVGSLAWLHLVVVAMKRAEARMMAEPEPALALASAES
ncbi:nitrate/nitrite transporter [Urbifossiella limnaea]|uniref:Putative nitrate transporter NarT n=1 Tax=Urbifossiella limnaea TaxID=2528023 RepID=A0A517XWY8_9BACT|nr:MFS transporter [Urbifossiella limnaea]QDU22030.1 putative nitrate transporter NarT [Urbifossiella limnaea]